MKVCTEQNTGLNGTVAMSLANGLVGTGFTSQYQLTQAVHCIPFTTMKVCTEQNTGLNGTVAMSSANGLVGTGFISQYHLQPERFFNWPQWYWVRISVPAYSSSTFYTFHNNESLYRTEYWPQWHSGYVIS